MLKSYSIATGSFESTNAASDILDQGGNAYDAILAALFMSFVYEPLLSSPGGGGYLLAHPNDKPAKVFDFFAQTPHHINTKNKDFYPIHGDFGTTQQEFHIGMASAATPGTPAGVFSIHEAYGSMPLIDIASAAIKKARYGMHVSAIHADVIQILSPIINHSKYARKIFSDKNNRLLKKGDIKTNLDLANFIENLATNPKNWFYSGNPANCIVSDMSDNNGTLTKNDFENYQVKIREPLMADINNWKIMTNSAPTTGGFLIIEQLKHALNNKNQWLSDKLVKAMQHADQLKNNQVFQFSKGTSHMSVIDSDGNVASMTVSNGEGCGYMVPNCGFMLNNFLGEEDINTGGFFNFIENTRMASMMSPTIIKNTEDVIALGTGGSNRIKTAMFQVIWQIIAENKTLDQAINHPRFHYENGILDIEKGINPLEIEKLQETYIGINKWNQRSLYFGGINAVSQGSCQFAIGDSRRKGVGVVKFL
ncbi:MAG: gamma-glutamyltransferase [Marinicellaceae bacterium]